MTETHQPSHDRVGGGYATSTATPGADYVPEKVRLLVWRRSRGKCAKCGGREGLDFDFIRPMQRGGTAAPEDVQLLCGDCLRQKSGVV